MEPAILLASGEAGGFWEARVLGVVGKLRFTELPTNPNPKASELKPRVQDGGLIQNATFAEFSRK